MKTAVEIDPPRIIDWNQIDLYRFFAFTFGAPTAERHRWFSQEGVAGALAELWRQISCEGPFPGFEWFPDFGTYEAAYIAVFDVGVPEPPVPLFESAHDKSRPAQELVLENTYFYDVLGLRVDSTHSMPDHLLTQLEFLSAVAYASELGFALAGTVLLGTGLGYLADQQMRNEAPILTIVGSLIGLAAGSYTIVRLAKVITSPYQKE